MHHLNELNQDSFPDEHIVALDESQQINWGQFIADITATRKVINTSLAEQWALFHADTYDFAVGLFALLAESKHVYLPAENHPGITEDLQNQQIELLGQFPAPSCKPIPLGTKENISTSFSLSGSIVIYTSGSTGDAKPIAKSLTQLARELLTLENKWGQGWDNPVIISTVSHQHFYGLLFSLLWPICAGREFVRRPFLDPAIMANSANHRDEVVWVMSPAHLHRMPQNMTWEDVRDKISTVFSSGGPLKQSAAQNIFNKLGIYPTEVLGSSETGGIASRQQIESDTPWQPLPGVDIKIDSSGTLAVKSPWLEDRNWYITSDLATLKTGGTFSLGMRADRIVKVEGKRVALPEVEAALCSHPWIDESVVINIMRQRQSLGAVVTLTAAGCIADTEKGRHLFTREIRQYLKQRLGSAAIPRLWRVAEKLPRNPQGKILDKEARKRFNQPPLPPFIKRESLDNSCMIDLKIEPDSPYLEGHFPDTAVLPGVVQLLWAQYFGKKFLPIAGEFLGMKKIKFRELVFPGTTLCLKLEYTSESGRLSFQYDSDKGRHSQGVLLFGVMPE